MTDMLPQEDLDALWNAAGQPDATQEDLNALWDQAIAEPTRKESFERILNPTEEDLAARRAMITPSPQSAGGIVGGIGGFMAGGPAGGFGGATLGGAFGKAAEDIYNQFVEPEKAPKTSHEAALNILKAGGEELAYEAGGQVIGKVAGKVYHLARPKIAGGIEQLQKTFEKYGGSFTAAERTESFLTQTIDSLTRGSLSGKATMRAADEVNDKALKVWQKDLSNQIASTAKEKMSDSEFGGLIKSTLTGGKSAFKSAMGEIYGSFDELVKTNVREKLIEKQVSSPILDASGKPIQSTILEKVIEEVRPVDMRPLKNDASKLLLKLKRIEKIGIGDFGGKTITDILNLDDALRFSDAQNLRSTLLDVARGVKNDPAEAKLAGSINKFVTKITESMDDAAKAQGKDVFKAYKAIKNEAETGYQSFNDDFVVKLLKDKTSAEKVGETLFRDGNETEIKAFRAAINRAAQYDKTIDPVKTFEQAQQKYIEALFNSTTRKIEVEAGESLAEHQARAGVVDATKMLGFLQNAKKDRTFQAMIPSAPQRDAIFDLVKTAAITQQKSVAGLSMLMQLSQGGVIINTISGAPGAIAKAATFFLPTTVLAKMMTNPKTARMMTSAIKTPITAKQAPALLSKIMISYENEQRKKEGIKTRAEEVIEFGKEEFKAL